MGRLLLHDIIALQCIANGEENPKIASSKWDFVTLMEEDRAMAIGNMHKKFDRDRMCGSGDMLADRQTDTHTHTQMCSSQYFATAPVGEVTKSTDDNKDKSSTGHHFCLTHWLIPDGTYTSALQRHS